MSHGDSNRRPVHIPTADYPITVAPTGRRVTVRIGGQIVADTVDALTLREADRPAVQYVPMADVRGDLLSRTDTTTYCPFKGDAVYYRVTTPDGRVVDDAIWAYEQPFDAIAAIAGHVAFYPDKADITVADG